jgi:LuxR family maltose regulon positive regulatory protein
MSGGDRPPAPGDTGFVDHRFAVPLATNVVVRPRLHARLQAGITARCVLIAAHAGWGKTLLASSWLNTGEAQGAAAWVSLGPTEDDLHAFWATVAEALLPAVGDPAAGSPRNAVAGDLEMAPGQVPAAVNGTMVVLVLDNLHEITRPVVHESFLRLVHRPPPGLRIVATTRRDPPWPLHRLRLAGVLTEIRAPDLAFREDETRALLDGLGIDLNPVHVGWLVERTEGSAAGLRLASNCRAQRTRPALSTHSPATTTPWPRTCWTK